MPTLFIDPGALRNEMSLQARQTTPDGSGGFTEDWVETARVFARIEPVSADSYFGAGQKLETTSHRITMRYRADVASGMRLEKSGRVFSILTVSDPDESGRYLVCRTREEGR